MISKLMVFSIALCVLMAPVSVLAQQKTLPAQANSSAAFKAKKDVTEKKIKDIENLVAKIVNGKRVSKGDAENLSRLMNEHGNAMNDAVKQTFADAEDAKKSNGQKGSIKSFVEFENMAKNHEQRAKAVGAKVKKIEEQIKTGDVEPDQPLLESMTPAERKEYMQSMTPGGREKMRKKHPKLLSGISVDTKTKLVDLERIGKSTFEICSSTVETVRESLVRIPETVSDLLVPPAEAVIGAEVALGCAVPGVNVVTCAVAIAGAALGYADAYNKWKTCYASKCACVWYKPWCCAGINDCWMLYIATCA